MVRSVMSRSGTSLAATMLAGATRLAAATMLAAGLAVCGALVASATSVAADEVSVPAELQVALLERIVLYERAYAAEATPVHVVIVSRASSPESLRVSGQLAAGLRRAGTLGGRAVDAATVTYTTAAALRTEVGSSHARIVYLAAGLGDEVPRITAALAGAGVITVSAVGADVERGAIVGFELVSARPRVVVNLTVARSEQLHFNAQFLRLARIVE